MGLPTPHLDHTGRLRDGELLRVGGEVGSQQAAVAIVRWGNGVPSS
jgi:hypothetical protein